MFWSDTSLRRLAEVRAAADGAQSVYLLRTRLHRLLLSMQRGIGAQFGLEVIKPGQLLLEGESDPTIRRISELCNEILRESVHLSQRSEALDERWEHAWTGLNGRLAELKSLLQKVALGDSDLL